MAYTSTLFVATPAWCFQSDACDRNTLVCLRYRCHQASYIKPFHLCLYLRTFNPFNASSSKLLLFEGFSDILV